MWDIVNWTNIITFILFLVSFGGGVMGIVGTTSPDFLIAKICFSAAVVILLVRTNTLVNILAIANGKKTNCKLYDIWCTR